MTEKIYKTISGAGIFNIVVGICSICVGIGMGVMMIINGAKLLKSKSSILL